MKVLCQEQKKTIGLYVFFAGGAHAKERLLKTCRVLYHWRQIGFSRFSDLEHDRRAAKTFFSFFLKSMTLWRGMSSRLLRNEETSRNLSVSPQCARWARHSPHGAPLCHIWVFVLVSGRLESASRRVAEDFAHAWDMEGPCVDLRVCWSHVLLCLASVSPLRGKILVPSTSVSLVACSLLLYRWLRHARRHGKTADSSLKRFHVVSWHPLCAHFR